MAQVSLGLIQPGTTGPVRATSNQTDPTLPVWAHKYRVWPLDANTGKGYAGNPNMLVASLDGVFGWCYPPTAVITQVQPYYESEPAESQQNPIDMSQIYIDADNGADQFLVTYVEA